MKLGWGTSARKKVGRAIRNTQETVWEAKLKNAPRTKERGIQHFFFHGGGKKRRVPATKF